LSANSSVLQHQFDTLEQQQEAGQLGMWLFLATELMIFGGLFTGYTVFRWAYPVAFAQASGHLLWVIASVNTAVLLTSSFTMAMAVWGAQAGRRNVLIGCLAATVLLGLVFLVLKVYEYAVDVDEGLVPVAGVFNTSEEMWPHWRDAGVSKAEFMLQARVFFSIYFVMTGLHALHMIGGMSVIGWLIVEARKGRFTPEYHPQIELTGLYWHFVDIVWIFLLPMLYLIGHSH
jgi:cytochrome c oxidase subunit 3